MGFTTLIPLALLLAIAHPGFAQDYTGNVRADDEVVVYADGSTVATTGSFMEVSPVTIPEATRVILAKVTNSGNWASGLIMDAGDVVTDGSWKCTNAPFDNSWAVNTFTCADWPAAYELKKANDAAWWGSSSPIRDSVWWIGMDNWVDGAVEFTCCKRLKCEYGPYGGSGGGPFDHSSLVSNGAITAVEVQASNYITKIRVKYGAVWSSSSGGGGGGNGGSFTLDSGETITKVEVQYAKYVNGMTFTTSNGKVYGPYGSTGSSIAVAEGSSLQYMSGRAGNHMDNFAFFFNC